MSTLFPKTITYYEITVSYVDGIGQKTRVEKSFLGSVQPMTGKDLELLPVGREDRGTVKVYSGTPLKVGIEGKQYTGDVVLWQGKEWEIVQSMDFQNGLIPHYKYIAEFRKEV